LGLNPSYFLHHPDPSMSGEANARSFLLGESMKKWQKWCGRLKAAVLLYGRLAEGSSSSPNRKTAPLLYADNGFLVFTITETPVAISSGFSCLPVKLRITVWESIDIL